MWTASTQRAPRSRRRRDPIVFLTRAWEEPEWDFSESVESRIMRLNSRLTLATSLMTLLIAAGCQSNGPKEPTQKELAVQKWNNARATVLISLAKEQYQGGQFEKCRHTLDDALKLSPENTQLHILSA